MRHPDYRIDPHLRHDFSRRTRWGRRVRWGLGTLIWLLVIVAVCWLVLSAPLPVSNW